jgi:hypothetical protein
VFVTYQIKIGADKTTFDYSKTAKAWRVDAVLNWLDTFKTLGPVCHY